MKIGLKNVFWIRAAALQITQIRDREVSQQDANHQNSNSLGMGSVLPTISVGKPRN
jgi:hypothetical protein